MARGVSDPSGATLCPSSQNPVLFLTEARYRGGVVDMKHDWLTLSKRSSTGHSLTTGRPFINPYVKVREMNVDKSNIPYFLE